MTHRLSVIHRTELYATQVADRGTAVTLVVSRESYKIVPNRRAQVSSASVEDAVGFYLTCSSYNVRARWWLCNVASVLCRLLEL